MMRFPALRIALEALATGGSATTVLNAANEVAVQAFLAKRIGFLAIAAWSRRRWRPRASLSPRQRRQVSKRSSASIKRPGDMRDAPAPPICMMAASGLQRFNSRDKHFNGNDYSTFGFGDRWLLTPLGFLFVLTIVVFFHELGHFLVARWCGVTVKAFSIGFGPEIFGFTDKKGTRWRLCWIPLGGYVKFIDDDNVASTAARR